MILLIFFNVILFLLLGFFLYKLRKYADLNKDLNINIGAKGKVIFDLQQEIGDLEEKVNAQNVELKVKSELLNDSNNSLEEYRKALEEGKKAINIALKYEEFYNSTLEDISEVLDLLDNLMNKRQMLSDDPDVQNIARVLAISHDILLGYINVRNEEEKRPEEQQRTEQQGKEKDRQ